MIASSNVREGLHWHCSWRGQGCLHESGVRLCGHNQCGSERLSKVSQRLYIIIIIICWTLTLSPSESVLLISPPTMPSSSWSKGLYQSCSNLYEECSFHQSEKLHDYLSLSLSLPFSCQCLLVCLSVSDWGGGCRVAGNIWCVDAFVTDANSASP